MEKIGDGFSGEVFRVFNEREWRESVIKIQKSFQGEEIAISLKVNELEGFVETRDYWVSPKGVCCLEMEKADGTLEQLLPSEDFSLKQRIEFYFEVVFTLNEAHKEIGFFHGDLRCPNILFLSSQKPRTYAARTDSIRIISERRPLLADFGRSFLVNDPYEGLQQDDLSALHTIQGKLFPKDVMERIGDPRLMKENYEPLLESLGNLITQ